MMDFRRSVKLSILTVAPVALAYFYNAKNSSECSPGEIDHTKSLDLKALFGLAVLVFLIMLWINEYNTYIVFSIQHKLIPEAIRKFKLSLKEAQND